jgi:glucose dehydrogenase
MTYSLGGRQYVVIAAGGSKDSSKRGDYLIA